MNDAVEKIRWDKINKSIILGMEGMIAKQEIMNLQARATVNALATIHETMAKKTDESEEVFAARKAKYGAMLDQVADDKNLKEEILENMLSEYGDFLSDLGELDTSILEDSNEKPKGCGCGTGSV